MLGVSAGCMIVWGLDILFNDRQKGMTMTNNRHTMPGKQSCFLLFAGYNCNNCGGWRDFAGYFPSVEAAKESAMSIDDSSERALRIGDDIYKFGWAHIVNQLTDEIELIGRLSPTDETKLRAALVAERTPDNHVWEWFDSY